MSWQKHYPKVGEKFAGFQVLKRIGSGGMAEVFLIYDENLAVERALKVIKLEFEGRKEVIYRFKREAKLHAQVQDNPQWVVPIHICDEYEQIPYLVMPYLLAGSLRDLVKKFAPLSENVVAKIIHELANALTVTESAALVHRDIKPSNILLQPNGYIALSDFGLATYDYKSAARSVAGTPGYMAPEQFVQGHAQDIRSDIFSLGCTLHFLLCGTAPFGYKIEEIFKSHELLKIGVLPQIYDSTNSSGLVVSSKLLSLRNKALKYDKESRFQNSEQMAEFIRDSFGRDFLDAGLIELKALVNQSIELKKKNDPSLVKTTLLLKEQ